MLNRNNLFVELYENTKIPYCYDSLIYKSKPASIYSNTQKNDTNVKKSTCYSNSLAPSYFNYKIKNDFKLLKVIQSNKGYSICINNAFSSANDYIKYKFKQKSKANILRSIKRLELCFDITYEHIYNDISDHKYNMIMNSLKMMLKTRFNYKNKVNEVLTDWDFLVTTFIGQIRAKTGSFFIVYSNKTPISISLLYHFKDIIFSGVIAFDMDYQKFGLGHVVIHKQLDICIDKKIKILEFGYGDLEYKQRWSNLIYNFENHIVYNKHSLTSRFLGRFEFFLITLKEYLKRHNIDVWVKKFKKIISFKKRINTNKLQFESVYSIDNLESCNFKEEINWKSTEYGYLLRFVYDFMYSNTVHVDAVKVFSVEKTPHVFIISANDKNQKININHLSYKSL